MLKEMFSKILQTQSKTVSNAIIQFTDTTDSEQKGRHFKSRFIQPGLANYPESFGMVLITKETLDKFIQTMVGKPVIINHQDITAENIEEIKKGEVEKVWYNAEDGWYWCSGYINDITAQNLITNKGWSVSCSYEVLTADDAGGTENNVKYDMEFLNGVFNHLALVSNPRYERANIVFNSKTVISNYNPDHDKEGKFCSGGNSTSFKEIQETKIYKNLDENLKKAVDFVYNTLPVAQLTGNEFQKDGVKLTDKVPEYYNKHYPNGVNNPILGNVKLDREGVKDSLGHKMSSAKAAAFTAVPNVIEKGYVFNQEKNWKNRGYDTAVIIAPIQIGDKDYICEVIVKQQSNRQGLYLHEVEISEKLADVLKTPTQGSTPTSSKLIIAKKISDLNPDIKENLQKADNNKGAEMEIVQQLEDVINKIKNGKSGKVENEKTDKRKLIDEVGGILKGKVDEELWRTVIGKLEKIAYDKSEAGTADNQKVENTEDKEEKEKDEEEYKELKKEVKEDVKNKKNCDNAVQNGKTDHFEQLNNVYNKPLKAPEQTMYVSTADRLKTAEEYFKR